MGFSKLSLYTMHIIISREKPPLSETNLIEPTKNQWLMLDRNVKMKLIQKSSFNEKYLLTNDEDDKLKRKM